MIGQTIQYRRPIKLALDATGFHSAEPIHGSALRGLHRHGGIVTHDQDVFVNVVGGIRVTDTGADLAVILAVLSSLRGRPLPAEMVVFGEVGLSGELRPVPNGSERLREAAKHGFRRALVPKANAPRREMTGLEVTAPEWLEAVLASI